MALELPDGEGLWRRPRGCSRVFSAWLPIPGAGAPRESEAEAAAPLEVPRGRPWRVLLTRSELHLSRVAVGARGHVLKRLRALAAGFL